MPDETGEAVAYACCTGLAIKPLPIRHYYVHKTNLLSCIAALRMLNQHFQLEPPLPFPDAWNLIPDRDCYCYCCWCCCRRGFLTYMHVVEFRMQPIFAAHQ